MKKNRWKKFVDWCWGVALYPMAALLLIVIIALFYGGWVFKRTVILW